MELLKVSRFKLQLSALISQVHQLKESERSANEQLQLTIQKQKQAEEDFSGKLTQLQAELDSSFEIRQKLERKVGCLESEIEMLENQAKGLKETISNLLQSKECFVKAYEHSFGEMRQKIEARDKQIQFLSEKVKSHLLLVEAFEKEMISITKTVENADSALKEREDVVTVLKKKVDVMTDLEKLFIVKINTLESKVRNNEEELTRKNKVIFNLEAQLEAQKYENSQARAKTTACQFQKESSSDQEILVESLIFEKKALQFEVANLSFAMKKVQDAVSHMDEQNKRAISLLLEGQDRGLTTMEHELNSFEDIQITEEGQITSCDENVQNAQEKGDGHIFERDNAVGDPVTKDDQNTFTPEEMQAVSSLPQSANSAS